MDILILNKKIELGPVFLYDDMEDTFLKVFNDNGVKRCILKHRGCKPVEVPNSYPTAFNIMLAGVEVTEQEFERF